MSRNKTVCLDQESEFRLNELFFSTTDSRGVIRDGNSVFVRVSKFSEEEILGKPHSLIRHPDMPRSVFRLFWNMIIAGDTIAAYVKNRSKDGSYYWVMAVAAPIADGYLSVRMKPNAGLLDIVSGVYATVLADEKAGAEDGLSKDEVAELGLVSLMSEINRLGFADYPTFMRHALTSEMAGRHEALGKRPFHHSHQTDLNSSDVLAVVNDLAEANHRCDELLGSMLERLSSLQSATASFVSISNTITTQSDSIGVAAMNAQVSANTPPREAIARALAEVESESREGINALGESIATIASSLQHLAFEVSVTALQSEVTSHFLSEIQANIDGDVDRALVNVRLLLSESERRTDNLSDRLAAASGWFGDLEKLTDALHRTAKSIRFVRMAGVKESANLAPDHAFRGLFENIKAHVLDTFASCSELRSQVKHAKETVAAVSHTKSMLCKEVIVLQQCNQRLEQFS